MNKEKLKFFLGKRIWLFGIAFILAFLAGTPFALLDFSDFISFFTHQKKLLESPWGIYLGKGWWYHLRNSLNYGLGLPLLLSGLLGILILVKTDWRKALILCSFPFVYYYLAGESYIVFVRYMLPVVSVLCIGSAVFIGKINCITKNILSNSLNKLTLVFLTILIITPSAYNIVQSNSLLAKKDNRVVVTEWLNENIPARSSIYQSGLWGGKLQIRPTLESLEQMHKENITAGEEGKMLNATIEYFKKAGIHGYEEWTYDVELRKFFFGSIEKNIFPDYIIVQESPLNVWSRTPVEIREILKSSYKNIKSFKVIDINDKENWFDQSLFMPFAGFKNVQRPGPNFYIYKRI